MWQDLEDAAWDHMQAGNTVQAAIAARLAIAAEPNAIDCYVILAQASDVLGQKQAYAREAIRLGVTVFRQRDQKRSVGELSILVGSGNAPLHARALHLVTRFVGRPSSRSPGRSD